MDDLLRTVLHFLASEPAEADSRHVSECVLTVSQSHEPSHSEKLPEANHRRTSIKIELVIPSTALLFFLLSAFIDTALHQAWPFALTCRSLYQLSQDEEPDSKSCSRVNPVLCSAPLFAFALFCGTSVGQKVVTCVTSGGGRGVTEIWPGKGSRKLEQMKSF